MNQILIVEDEPTLCDAYQFILKTLQDKGKIDSFKTYVGNSYLDTREIINEFIKTGQNIDICILDFRLGAIEKTHNKNGMGIGILLRKHFPECKIMLITSISDKYLYHTIIRDLRPSGFLLKNETSFDSIEKDICAVLEGKMVYSKSINNFVKKGIFSNTSLNHKDLKILHLMSEGNSLPKIAQIVGLSLSGLEYRKRRIAVKLGAKSSSIKDILVLAQQELNLL